MKYIDAELLRAEIERFSATEYGDNTFGDDIANGALDYVLEEIIPSLQQEPTPDTLACHTELVNLLKRYRIGEETASTMADRIADTYGAQRYMDGLCDGLNLNKEDTKQGQLEEEKGKFAFPKYLYARTTNNKTIDVAYGPQSMDAVEYVRNDSLQQEPSEVDLETVVRIDNIVMSMLGEGYNSGYKTRPFYEEALRRLNVRKEE